MKRREIFARDAYRCVYCGTVFPEEMLTVDHVQPRARSGDRSGGNLVTACRGCNRLKGHLSLAEFLRENADAQANFRRWARYVWPRHLRALEEELAGAERRSGAGRAGRRRDA